MNSSCFCLLIIDTVIVVDVKSILGLMSLAIPSGENVILVATGDQALTAIEEIEKILG